MAGAKVDGGVTLLIGAELVVHAGQNGIHKDAHQSSHRQTGQAQRQDTGVFTVSGIGGSAEKGGNGGSHIAAGNGSRKKVYLFANEEGAIVLLSCH